MTTTIQDFDVALQKVRNIRSHNSCKNHANINSCKIREKKVKKCKKKKKNEYLSLRCTYSGVLESSYEIW